ncbi:hypothetical protein T484DRAFT_1944587 [Baffinella frigidus]|nr:hypothetical protein T484DRAFT_1944587 [Cryptophyta sp. CCMP2293]
MIEVDMSAMHTEVLELWMDIICDGEHAEERPVTREETHELLELRIDSLAPGRHSFVFRLRERDALQWQWRSAEVVAHIEGEPVPDQDKFPRTLSVGQLVASQVSHRGNTGVEGGARKGKGGAMTRVQAGAEGVFGWVTKEDQSSLTPWDDMRTSHALLAQTSPRKIVSGASKAEHRFDERRDRLLEVQKWRGRKDLAKQENLMARAHHRTGPLLSENLQGPKTARAPDRVSAPRLNVQPALEVARLALDEEGAPVPHTARF